VKYLLDTCVISEFVKAQPAPGLIAWLRDSNEDQMAISVASIAEIQSGIARLPASERRNKLEDWLHQDLIPRFEPRILPVDLQTALAWGAAMGWAKRAGRPVPQIDALLASVCRTRNLLLVTRNVKDFEKLEVELLNPWQGATPTL